MKKILVTGGTGFVGSAIMRDKDFSEVLAATRQKPKIDCNYKIVNFSDNDSLKEVMRDIDVVIHLAARAHILNDTSVDPTQEYFNANTDLTLRLAKHAANLGVSRFIFLSTIKTLGESTCAEENFNAASPYHPMDPYAKSKVDAEIGLCEIASSSKMDYVIIRPPLIYGEGIKGNLQRLTKLIKSGYPFPIPNTESKRSFVSVENLLDFIKVCIDDRRAANKTFLISDDYDLTIKELISILASSAELPDRSIKIPDQLLRFLLTLIGQRSSYDRLSGRLTIDITETKKILGWKPPYSPHETLLNCFIESNV